MTEVLGRIRVSSLQRDRSLEKVGGIQLLEHKEAMAGERWALGMMRIMMLKEQEKTIEELEEVMHI